MAFFETKFINYKLITRNNMFRIIINYENSLYKYEN